MLTLSRYAHHDDDEHDARLNGFEAGWSHANYVEAYGWSADSQMPDRYRRVSGVWRDAYQEGKDEFEAQTENEEIYGHDWRG
jgi:hypothetical protein